MTTYRYKSDSVYKDAVLKFYAVGWFGGLGIVIVAAITILIIYGRQCVSLKWAVAGLPAVHIISWLIIANLMCATFQTMARMETKSTPPTPEDDGREIPITKGVKNGTVNWQ